MRKILLTLLSFICFNSHAELMAGNHQEWVTHEGRVKLAIRLSTDFQKLQDAIPVPRPKDVEWVAAENEAINKVISSSPNTSPERLIAFRNSTEYQQVTVREAIGNLLGWLRCVTETNSRQQEMLCWAGVTLLMIDEEYFGDGIKVLRKANMIPASLDSTLGISPNLGMSARTRFIGQMIHSQITIPYLRGELK